MLVTELGYGGTPRSVERLARELHRRHAPVTVISLMSARDIAHDLRRDGVEVVTLDVDRVGVVRAFYRLIATLRALQRPVLHTFLFHANLLGRIAGRLAGVRAIVASERSVELAKVPARVWADRLTWRLADRWTTNAAATARVLVRRERIAAERIDIIPSGVDAVFFAPRPDDGAFRRAHDVPAGVPLVVCVGRLDRYKGQRLLLDAFRLASAERPDMILALVGDGRLRDSLAADAARLGVADRVRFCGSVADVRPALAAAQALVLPSDEEGLPAAILEALAMGVPVVATAVGGTPEALDHGRAGLLVRPGDAPALARAMLRALHDGALREGFRAHGRRLVEERFSLARTVELTEMLYSRL